MTTQFNSFERKIASWLGKFPIVKKTLKQTYLFVNYIIYRNNQEYSMLADIRSFSLDGEESFFGYYDKTPISEDGSKLLFHSSSFPTDKTPIPNQSILIVLYDYDNNKVIKTFETKAWNWQQGARLQWLTNDLFAFNDYDKELNIYVTQVISCVQGLEVQRIHYPLQDAYKNKFFLSLNYARICSLRPDYGYRNKPCLNEKELQNLHNDGIWYVDFKTGKGYLLLTLKDIVQLDYKNDFQDAKHYVNHIMISPNGESFVFLHRYFKQGVRFDRLIFSDLKGNLTLLADYEMVSHFSWYGNDHIFGYMRGLDRTDGYYMVNCKNQEIHKYEDIEIQKYGDGHPHIFGDSFLSDTYPDKARIQRLIYGDLRNKKHTIIAYLRNGIKYVGESRCDLHPRLALDDTKAFFDSVHDGKRKLYVMDLTNIQTK